MDKTKRIEKARWLNDANSPVVLMVDDFANVWIDLDGNGIVDPGEDWGHALDSPNSAFSLLNEHVLRHFPEVKTTFFVPLAVVPLLKRFPYRAHFGPINENETTISFFRSVGRDERFEIAYHGLTHGISGNRTEDFSHEWEAYRSLDEALATIEKGRALFREVFGEYPRGGKYCGYKRNEFSEESIDKSGFLWWCREWDRGREDVRDETRFDTRYFGVNAVIDVPSTVHGSIFNPPRKGLPGRWLGKRTVLRRAKRQLDQLLEKKLVIGIQEHTSPARVDGKRQTPNVHDDREGLRLMFEHLNTKNV
ncbi:MAG: hypothetical protein V2A71_07880, partial [Candidatus Eisenbacteria bacterium]